MEVVRFRSHNLARVGIPGSARTLDGVVVCCAWLFAAI